MKKNKRGQFYFIAVILLATLFVGIIAIRNQLSFSHQTGLIQDKNELDTEISSTFDYLGNNPSENKTLILTNFSENYIKKIGSDKDIFFIFGNKSEVNLIGNKLNDSSFSIDSGSGDIPIYENGTLKKSYPLSEGSVNLTLDEIKYNFIFNEGENFYYLIKQIYNNQTFIING